MLASDAGMINCCSLPESTNYCFRVPDNYVDLLPMLPDYRSCANARSQSVDRSSKLLHAVPIVHDPYTPDSMDSPSPNAIITTGYEDTTEEIITSDETPEPPIQRSSSAFKRIDAAVSPALLKSKLELIARNESSQPELVTEKDAERRSEDCKLHSWPYTVENRDRGLRKKRCNSDVSWQRSHLLTQSWIQDKARQGYRSFAYSQHRSSSDSSPADPGEILQTDLVIPRISIINASNFHSNESSVHLQEDRRLGLYSRDGSIRGNEGTSGEGSSLDTSEDIHELTKRTDKLRLSSRAQDSGLDVGDESFSRGGSFGVSSNETGSTPPLDTEELEVTDWKGNSPLDIKTIAKDSNDIANATLQEDSNLLSRINKGRDGTGDESSFSRVCRDDTNRSSTKLNDIEILRADGREDTLLPKIVITRSDSEQSQDISSVANVGKEKLKLKAFKVTERYRRDIVGKNGTRCDRCCCVIS